MTACSKQLSIDTNALKLFALVPLTDQLITEQLSKSIEPVEIAIRSSQSNVNLSKIEQILVEKSRSEDLLQKTNEALMTFVNELKRIKKVLFAAVAMEDTDSKADSGDGR